MATQRARGKPSAGSCWREARYYAMNGLAMEQKVSTHKFIEFIESRNLVTKLWKYELAACFDIKSPDLYKQLTYLIRLANLCDLLARDATILIGDLRNSSTRN